MTQSRKFALILSISTIAITINTLPPFVISFSSSLNVSTQLFGTAFLFQSLAFVLFSTIVGFLQKKRDLPLILILVISLFVDALAVMALGHVNSFIILLFLLFIIGGTSGLVESIGTALLSTLPDQGKMIYTSQFLFAIGALSAPLLVGILFKVGTSVPLTTLIVGLFTFTISLVVALLLTLSREKSSTEAETPLNNTKIIDQLPTETFVWMIVAIIAYVMSESAFASWLPTYLEEVQRFSQANASLGLTSFWIGLGLSRFIYIYYKKKNTQGPLIIYGWGMVLTVALIAIASPYLPFWPIMVLVGLFGYWCGPVWPLLIEHCSNHYENVHYVIYLVGAGSIGALIGPMLTSFIFGLTALSLLPYIIVVYTLILVLTIVVVGVKSRIVAPKGA